MENEMERGAILGFHRDAVAGSAHREVTSFAYEHARESLPSRRSIESLHHLPM